MNSMKVVYFSPTGTSKAVAQGIVDGFNPASVGYIDITNPKTRKTPLRIADDELLLVAMPVYMGRIPAIATEWLTAMQAQGTPTVCIVVYGNRAYEDALLELHDITKDCGCIPLACAAYVGEHSFSKEDTPVAPDRPDQEDLLHAKTFGQHIREKLENTTVTTDGPEISVPGTRPYGGRTTLWDVDFINVDDSCTQCGLCAKVCPVGAVDTEDSSKIDQQACITCCACIKSCPQQARTIKAGPVQDASVRLHTTFSERKEPECFL